ncbi:hypothetical protein [Ornithinimicrobium kibberense]|uniref:hypothetical protein n=1 Tax=Ornithinimicrobium kibberense TaxID=282060 RepID=UPI0036111DC8
MRVRTARAVSSCRCDVRRRTVRAPSTPRTASSPRSATCCPPPCRCWSTPGATRRGPSRAPSPGGTPRCSSRPSCRPSRTTTTSSCGWRGSCLTTPRPRTPPSSPSARARSRTTTADRTGSTCT